MLKNKFSYFVLLLRSHLEENFPDKANDFQFINSRSELTATTYSQAILDGYSHWGASEKASEVLFKGLHFSPYSTIIEVLRNEFDDKVPEPVLQAFAQILLVMSRKLFSRYELSDDLAFTPEYELLYTELTGFILIILEKNGLQ